MNSFTSMNSLYDDFITEKYLAEAEGEINVLYFLILFQTVTRDNMKVKRSALLLRLRPEDREVIRKLAEYYDIAEADVVKILIREYLKNHKTEVGSSLR